MEVDSVLRCGHCPSAQWAYRLHRVRKSRIAFGWTIKKASADLPDLRPGTNATCPDCGRELSREAP